MSRLRCSAWFSFLLWAAELGLAEAGFSLSSPGKLLRGTDAGPSLETPKFPTFPSGKAGAEKSNLDALDALGSDDDSLGLGGLGGLGLGLEEDWLAEALFQDIAEENAALYGKVLEVKLSNDSQEFFLEKELPAQGTVRKAPRGVSSLVSVSIDPDGDALF
mmetsp:Transcript_14106/g.21290  ORF Transcript_14106/g.21290 Transcript_14106/m.21290 type:complete len:161 (+) Transcript_14106:132-614(+)